MGDGRSIAVAQLSMVDAAEQFAKEMDLEITHPLQSLVEFVVGKGYRQ